MIEWKWCDRMEIEVKVMLYNGSGNGEISV